MYHLADNKVRSAKGTKETRRSGFSFPLCPLLCLTVICLVAVACSTQKNTAQSRWWQSCTARYNTYYNGSLAFIDGNVEKEDGNKDNYTEFIPLYAVGNKNSRNLGSGNYSRAIEKMEKTIKQHSIKSRPEWNKNRRKTDKDREWLGRHEYNPFLWKAWLLMGKAQFQKGDFDEAAATFSYMSRLYQTQPMQYSLARAWLAKCYTELNWLYDAEDVIRNMSRDSIHYRAQKDWDYTMADYYIRNNELERAVPYLQKVIKHEPRKKQKAREWFLLGQIQAALGHHDLAYKAFQKVIAQNPPYELAFNARIAQTEAMVPANDQAAGQTAVGRNAVARKMIARLKRMAANDNNKDYLDQVYYAIGNIYLTQRDTAQAIGAYEKGREKATRSGIEKGVLLLRLGNLYWEMEKYDGARECYGEAIGLLDKDRPDYPELSNRSKVLDELVPHTDAIHLQDSLQALSKMPEDARNAAIDRVIEALKKQEKEEKRKAQEQEAERQQQRNNAVGNRTQRTTTPQARTNNQDATWYFYNPMAVNQGKQQFQRTWGKRDNVDNWQRANRTVVASTALAEDGSDLPNDSLQAEATAAAADSIAANTAQNDSAQNDPHKREYYLAQIPFTEDQLAESDNIIKDALFNSGVIFKDKLDNLRQSEKQLLRLKSQYPDFERMDETWYHLFLLYARLGDRQQADSCIEHLKNGYPESQWTVLLCDPYFEENARFGIHIEDSLYAATYDAFKHDRHDEIRANARLSAERFPLGENRAKFIFIDGLSLLNSGDAKGCTEQLQQVVDKYPQSEVAGMAGMIVKGVQEGRQLYGGKFDLGDVWSRRDIVMVSEDSVRTDTLSTERNTHFLFLLVYNPDSLYNPRQDGQAASGENQLLYEMARFNFSNFLVRNFEISIERAGTANRMLVGGFISFDEALQYARQLYADADMARLLRPCRSLLVSEPNLPLVGTRFSYDEYQEFYEKTFIPLKISEEQLLIIPEAIEQPADDEPADAEQAPAEAAPTGKDFDFDDDFF